LLLREQGEANVPLDDGVDPSTHDCQPRQGGKPCRCLEPHRADRRGVLDPAQAGFHRRVLLLIRVANLDIPPGLRTHGRGTNRPPSVRLRVTQGCDLNDQAIAWLRRWRVRLGGTSPTSASRAACICDAALASGVIPPKAWATPSWSLPAGLIRRDRSFGIGETSKPPGLHVLPMVCDRCGCLRLGDGLGLGWLLRQWTRRHPDNAHRFLSDPPLTVLHLYQPPDTLPMPASGRLVLRPPRCLHPQGPGRRLLPPRVEGLTHRPGARDEGHQPDPLLQT
jgi:hypothetical protein